MSLGIGFHLSIPPSRHWLVLPPIQEALERAYAADQQGWYDAALRSYGITMEAASEGLGLQVAPGNGLGPKADTVACWRNELAEWAKLVDAR